MSFFLIELIGKSKSLVKSVLKLLFETYRFNALSRSRILSDSSPSGLSASLRLRISSTCCLELIMSHTRSISVDFPRAEAANWYWKNNAKQQFREPYCGYENLKSYNLLRYKSYSLGTGVEGIVFHLAPTSAAPPHFNSLKPTWSLYTLSLSCVVTSLYVSHFGPGLLDSAGALE